MFGTCASPGLSPFCLMWCSNFKCVKYQHESPRSQDTLIRGSCTMNYSEGLFSILWILNCTLTLGCDSLMEAESCLYCCWVYQTLTYIFFFSYSMHRSLTVHRRGNWFGVMFWSNTLCIEASLYKPLLIQIMGPFFYAIHLNKMPISVNFREPHR